MKKLEFARILSDIDPKLVYAAGRSPRRQPIWLRYTAAAACLCLIAAVSILALLPNDDKKSADHETGDGPPALTLEGVTYIISPYLAVSETLPDGFVYGGTAAVEGVGECAYYIKEEMSEWVYVRQEVRTTGEVDASGTLIPAEPHEAYARYVDARLRGRDLIAYNGQLYISLWTAQFGDTDETLYQSAKAQYGLRTETLPDGFASVGAAIFAGHDAIPEGTLAANIDNARIYANAELPELLFVSTVWYTAPDADEIRHDGWDTYILYTGTLEKGAGQ